MKGELFSYQETGVKWMLERETAFPKGGCLFDECGLGKTLQVIATLARNPQKNTLIICPVNILSQWVDQLHKWVPQFKVLLYHPSKTINQVKNLSGECLHDKLYSLALSGDDQTSTTQKTTPSHSKNTPVREPRVPLVVVTSYGKTVNMKFERQKRLEQSFRNKNARRNDDLGITTLSSMDWGRLVLDEGHIIRNSLTVTSKYVLALSKRASIKWILSATPVHSGIQDYYTLLRILGLDRDEIAQVMSSSPLLKKYVRKQYTTGFHRQMHPISHEDITLRRTKKQVFSAEAEELCCAGTKRRLNFEDDISEGPMDCKKRKVDIQFLPLLTVEIVEVDFCSKDEEDFYHRVENLFFLDINTSLDSYGPEEFEKCLNGAMISEMREQQMFEIMLRLRQASVNPALVVQGYKRKFNGTVPKNLLFSDQEIESMSRNKKKFRLQEGKLRCKSGVLSRRKSANLLLTQKEHTIMKQIGIPSKTRKLLELIKGHLGREKAIVFCEFREEMPFLKAVFEENGITSVLYDGSLTLDKRAEVVKQIFRKEEKGANEMPEVDVAIIQINSGNAGLNLACCSRVYFTNPNFNPCVEIQAISRSHRYGQDRPVHVVKLVLSGKRGRHQAARTIDQRILEIQEQKRRVMADLLGDKEILFNGAFRGP